MLNIARTWNLPTLDWLRAEHVKIHFFGLGFIQVKLRDGTRYHFYHPDLPAFVEHPHDHRYHFTSHVLKGTIATSIWKVVPEGTEGGIPSVLRYDACSPEEPAPTERRPVAVLHVNSFYTSARSSYYLDENTFHQAQRLGEKPLITYLELGPKVKKFASILVLGEQQEDCPFSRNRPEEQLWEYVRECLEA